jgi:hypothetical protein
MHNRINLIDSDAAEQIRDALLNEHTQTRCLLLKDCFFCCSCTRLSSYMSSSSLSSTDSGLVRRNSMISSNLHRTLSQEDIITRVLSRNSPYSGAVIQYFSQENTARFGCELLFHQPTFFVTDAQLSEQLSPRDEWSYVGSGSFGTIFRATWMGITVAVKTPLETRSDSIVTYQDDFYTDFSQLFEEFEMHRRVRHPNIISFFVASPQLHVMEFAENTLQSLLEGPAPDLSQRRKWLKQLNSAIRYMHTFGLVHSDLKVDNVMLDEYYNIKLIDFGASYLSFEDIKPKYKIVSDKWVPLHTCIQNNDEAFGESTDVYALSLLHMTILDWTRDIHAELGLIDFERRIDKAECYPEKEAVVSEYMDTAVKQVVALMQRAKASDVHTKAVLKAFLANSSVRKSETLEQIEAVIKQTGQDVHLLECVQ